LQSLKVIQTILLAENAEVRRKLPKMLITN
jgi:hypothetical protein